jgi:zinc transport system permease protein
MYNSIINTGMAVFDIFQYSFMVRALIAGLIVAVTVPLLGSFLVARRYALISDSLAHVSLAGVGAGLLLGLAPIYVAVPVTVAGALMLEWLRQKRQLSGDVGLAILMSGGLALAIVFASLARGAQTDFNSYLFGSITTTTQSDVIMLAVISVLAVVFVAFNYRTLVHVAYDEDSAYIAGKRVGLLNCVTVALTAALVVSSLQIVGGLLISAILVMPVVAASRFSTSFTATVRYAIAFAVLSVIIGLIIAFYAGVPAGGAIVLTALTFLIGIMIWKK